MRILMAQQGFVKKANEKPLSLLSLSPLVPLGEREIIFWYEFTQGGGRPENEARERTS
jgi:hypothetical protein